MILLPGADLARSFEQAERLRQAIENQSVGDGQQITMSFGVAASRRSTGFLYETVSGEADCDLYDAKRTGRNRVAARSSVRQHLPAKTRRGAQPEPAHARAS